MLYALPGSADAKVQYKSRYDNFILVFQDYSH